MWYYDSVNLFFHKYFDNLLTENMISGNEMFITEYKDEEGLSVELNRHLFPIKKNKLIYLVPTEAVNKLPIMVMESEKVAYMSKGYRLVKKYKPMKIMPEKTMTLKELVTSFAVAQHNNKDHDFYWRLLSIISYIDRINIRVATNPEFGKDSKLNIISSLTGEIGKISNPTIAKMEYLLFNKVLFINEVAGINSQSKQDVEQFLLQCGDFNNEYNKRSRASVGTTEKYDISKLSLVIAYNDLKQYGDKKEKYFDFMWVNRGAINNRILPFLFEGKIMENFTEVFNVEKTVNKNFSNYVRFLRALLYYKEMDKNTAKYKWLEFNFETERWKRNFAVINKWVDEVAESQEEYEDIVKGLYKAHLSYLKMVGYQIASTSNDTEDTQPNPLFESAENKHKQEVRDYLELHGEVDTVKLLTATKVPEEIINKMKQEGILYEKSGKINLLK